MGQINENGEDSKSIFKFLKPLCAKVVLGGQAEVACPAQ